MASKHQMTRAKMDREQALKEKRALKQQRRDDRKQAAAGSAMEAGDTVSEHDAGAAASPNE